MSYPARRSFCFTGDEIDSARENFRTWHQFVRRREAEMIFSLFPNHRFTFALELGAGDGGQSMAIVHFCKKLICTELSEEGNLNIGRFAERKLADVEYRLCNAQDLSEFKSDSFDLIFSSNVLEHVEDFCRCLKECTRVLHPQGIMIHIMPGRAWKSFNYFLSLVRYRRKPGIHGISKSHLYEWYKFGPRVWEKRFADLDLVLAGRVGLPFYVGHGNKFIAITKLGNLMGLSASFAYVLHK